MKRLVQDSELFRINAPAYLTVYLTLSMTIMISLCLALIEGVRSNAIRLETECIMDIGLNSILAEYHRELFRQYNLFAIDSSYGTSLPGRINTEQHLKGYVERNMSIENAKDFLMLEPCVVELVGVSILTDDGGAAFRRQAVEVIKDDVGLTLLTQLADWMRVVEINHLATDDIAMQKQNMDAKLKEYNGKKIQILENWATIEIENPTRELEENRSKGTLALVLEDTDKLSTSCLAQKTLIASRMEQGKMNQGNMILPQLSGAEQLVEKFLFQEYLLKYMGYYGSEKEDAALSYQAEYLIAGKDCDIDNLKSVVNRLTALREAANALYIFSDKDKCAEADLVALAVCGLFQIPELHDLLKGALLLAWAYAESLYDVQMLLQGERVPLIKNKDSWHYDLEGALSGFQRAEAVDCKVGLCYEDYLRIMLTLTDVDTVTARAMNLIEADMRLTPGNAGFRMDGCYVRAEAFMKVKSAFGYTYEITRQVRY